MCVKTRNAVALPTIFSFFLSLVSATVFSQTTIEGFGSQVTGGAGQTVVYVTNLNATGPGSLHAAMEATGISGLTVFPARSPVSDGIAPTKEPFPT